MVGGGGERGGVRRSWQHAEGLDGLIQRGASHFGMIQGEWEPPTRKTWQSLLLSFSVFLSSYFIKENIKKGRAGNKKSLLKRLMTNFLTQQCVEELGG